MEYFSVDTNGNGKIGSNTNYHRLALFECGSTVLEEFYAQNPDVPDHGSLLQSVVNFQVAVDSDIFVGVSGSSYSTDVWATATLRRPRGWLSSKACSVSSAWMGPRAATMMSVCMLTALV